MLSRDMLSRLVTDWGGFEKLIATLCETGQVTVTHDGTLVGKSGAARQIDVLIRHRQGLVEHLTVVECKYWNTRVKRQNVDELGATVRDVGASRGVMFSAKGFQKGALTQARFDNIDLFKLREPTDKEWGLPGRHIDFYLQFISRSLANLQLHEMSVRPAPPVPAIIKLDIRLGFGAPESETAILPQDGYDAKTLETLIDLATWQAVPKVLGPISILLDGKNGERRIWKRVEFAFPSTVQIPITASGVIVVVPKISLDLGLKLKQVRIQKDRGEHQLFVLAVEDCVRGNVTLAARQTEQQTTALIRPSTTAEAEGPLVNGSILSIHLQPLEPFDEFTALSKGEPHDNYEWEADESLRSWPKR
jgi:hypothetical protein